MFFEPSFLHINSGDDVTFIPSGFGHQPQSIFIPKEGKHWQSENGKKITVKFDKEGIYIFDCKYHYVMGMVGVIQVGRANNYKEAINFLKDYKKKVTMRKERLDSIFKKVKH